ncbi:MAG: hypothetical protein QGF12_03215, partial [SAR202 cluster bacterium]|nr:hypothetical protein [SAR202 cluster bacterium]
DSRQDTSWAGYFLYLLISHPIITPTPPPTPISLPVLPVKGGPTINAIANTLNAPIPAPIPI